MQKKYSFMLALGMLASVLGSCSRSTYSFQNPPSAYVGNEQIARTAPKEVDPTPAPVAPQSGLDLEVSGPALSKQDMSAELHRQHRTSRVNTAMKVGESNVAASSKLDHASRKALRQELKRQLFGANKTGETTGKSQLVALLLLIFLGGLGIHRFYLGYTGRGILYIALLLTSFLIVPLIALLVLLIIDLINVITGKLKPKNGEYAKTL